MDYDFEFTTRRQALAYAAELTQDDLDGRTWTAEQNAEGYWVARPMTAEDYELRDMLDTVEF